MHVDVFPREAAIVPGQQQVLSITVTNTATVIGGYSIRVLGADPGWVSLDVDEISLFPDEVRTVTAVLTPPQAMAAGSRRIAIQVRELTPPHDSSVTELDLTVPEQRGVQVRVDPLTVTGGRAASFSVIAENTGNTVINGHLGAADAEARLNFAFEPGWISLAPGEHAVVDMTASGRRHLIGTPAVRMIGLYLDEVDEPFFGDAAAERQARQPARDPQAALANATFLQRAFLARGSVSLIGLLAAITVFAIVITIALSRLVGQSTADRDLALEVAQARNATGSTGTSGISGTVRQLTSGKTESGVSVSAYPAADTSTPIATAATNSQGVYDFSDLAAGSYKLSFRGAGFEQVWYPNTADPSNATPVTLIANQHRNGVNVVLGGVPATISGTVVGSNVAASTLYLEQVVGGSGTDAASTRPLTDPTPSGSTAPTGTGGSTTGGTTTGGTALGGTAAGGTTNGSTAGGSATTNPLPDDGNAIVQTVPVGADGTFTLTNVPSPSVYELVVTKTGFAPARQRIDVGAGEDRTGVQITLLQGDGLIAGTISSPTGPLPGATITATAGQTTQTTVSLSGTGAGGFTLRSLPTPASFTVVASAPGYTTQTVTITLTSGQRLSGVALTLGASSGQLGGQVDLTNGSGAGGVSVLITDGQNTVQTETQSGSGAGSWSVSNLPIPGSYTITFSRGDLQSQTVSASLDSAGNVTPGSQGTRVDASGRIQITMVPATATVYGTVVQAGAATTCPGSNLLGEATVTLNSGTQNYSVTTASVPASRCGQFEVDDLPPGTYSLTVTSGTGTTPTSQVFTLRAGDDKKVNVALTAPASIAGLVNDTSGTPVGNYYVFLYPSDDYPDTFTRSTTTASNGTFAFDGVPAGTYVVAVGPSGDPTNATATKRITVSPSEVTKVTITVQR